jgi:hypothetical protein
MKNPYTTLVRKLEGEKQMGRPGLRCHNNIKMDVRVCIVLKDVDPRLCIMTRK